LHLLTRGIFVDLCQVSGLGRLSRLRRLSLRDLTGITDAALQSLAPRLRQLEVLVLLGCGRLTDAGISCLVDLRATLKVRGPLLCRETRELGGRPQCDGSNAVVHAGINCT
jgi:hypothetical protein